MQSGEIAFLCLAVGAISTFGGVLAWASWMECRAGKRAQIQPKPSVEHHATAAPAHRAF